MGFARLVRIALLLALGCAAGPRSEPVSPPVAGTATADVAPTEASAVSGRLRAHDGTPVSAASIEVTAWQNHRIAWLVPEADGTFQIDTSFRGLARVTIHAPGHRLLRFSLLLDGTPLTLDARLGTHTWKASPKVVGLAHFGPAGHGRRLELQPQPDGTWTTAITISAEDREAARVAAEQTREHESKAYPTWDPKLAEEMSRASRAFVDQRIADTLGPDELAYSISGVTADRDWWLPGTQADRVNITDGRSVVRVDGGEVRLVFDPKELPPSGLEPELRIAPESSAARAIAVATLSADRWRSIHERSLEAGAADGAAVDAMLEQSRQEAQGNADETTRDAMTMQALVLAAWTDHDDSTLFAAMARELLRALPPDDPLWSMSSAVLPAALEAVNDPDPADYGARALETHADHEMLASVLASRLYAATVSGDDTAARAAWTQLHSERFAQTNIARHSGGMDPDRATAPGNPVPSFSVPALDDPNARITERTLAGKPYLLALWATWCSPCVAELPKMHEAYEHLHERYGLEILAVSYDEDPRSVTELRNTWPMPWVHAIATTRAERGVLDDALLSSGLPTHLLIGADGKVIADDVLMRGEDLERFVAQRLEASP